MKINFVFWNTSKSGGTRAIFETINILAKEGYKINIISLGKKEHDWMRFDKNITFFYPEGKNMIYIPFKGRIPLRKLISKFLKIFNKYYELDEINFLASNILEADATIATSYQTAFPVFYGGKGKKYYYIQHYEPIFSDNFLEKKKAEITYYLPLKKFAVSKWLCRLINKKTKEKVEYVGDGVNTKTFKVINNKKENIIFGFLRGLEWKGDYDLLKSMEIIQKEFPSFKIILAGFGNPRRYFNRIHKKLNFNLKCNIIKNPSENELVSIYSRSKIFIFASHLEGFGLPPLEAMACETPVVTTFCKGNEDYIKNRVNCLAVPIKNPEMIANAVIELINNNKLYEKIQKNGLKTAREFSWNKVAHRLKKILNS